MEFPIHRHLRVADRVAEFIEHVTTEDRIRRKPQHEMLSVEIRASYYRGRELFMLVVAGGNVSTFSREQLVLAGRDMKLEAPIIAGYKRLQVLTILGVRNRNASTCQRAAGLGVNGCSRDSVRTGRDRTRLPVFRLCRSQTTPNHTTSRKQN
jgi:hypothetical protein